jgi:hypothetical protein
LSGTSRPRGWSTTLAIRLARRARAICANARTIRAMPEAFGGCDAERLTCLVLSRPSTASRRCPAFRPTTCTGSGCSAPTPSAGCDGTLSCRARTRRTHLHDPRPARPGSAEARPCPDRQWPGRATTNRAPTAHRRRSAARSRAPNSPTPQRSAGSGSTWSSIRGSVTITHLRADAADWRQVIPGRRQAQQSTVSEREDR